MNYIGVGVPASKHSVSSKARLRNALVLLDSQRGSALLVDLHLSEDHESGFWDCSGITYS